VKRDSVINVHLDVDLVKTPQLTLPACAPLACPGVVTLSAAASKANYDSAASPEEFSTTSPRPPQKKTVGLCGPPANAWPSRLSHIVNV